MSIRVQTENGMTTNESSLNANVDLFFTIGALRGKDKSRLIALFSAAYQEDPITAMKILFWARDVRGGAGERQIFKDCLEFLIESGNEAHVLANLSQIPAFGRWDDISVLFGTTLQENALKLIVDALNNGDQLCAKWMPRPNKNDNATLIRKRMGLSPKEYRKLLVNLTNTVESKMCAKDWGNIEFDKLPSLASARYQKAFGRNAFDQYTAYIKSLVKGTKTINAGAVYPYDVIKSLKNGNQSVASAQWLALPNWMEGVNERILPLVDVSGSMDESISKKPGDTTCLDVAISLGLYIAERNVGQFKDRFITFSAEPSIVTLNGGSLVDRYEQMRGADWQLNTNIQKVFELILDQAVTFNTPESEMPTKILILSDMEFDRANMAYRRPFQRLAEQSSGGWNPGIQELIKNKYCEAGYTLPDIIYWNLSSRHKNVPVRYNECGTALISGFSPAILTSLLHGKILSPVDIMIATIGSSRYDVIQ